MRPDCPSFFSSMDKIQRVTAYAAEHSSSLPKHIIDYHADASSHEASMMLTSNFQSQFHTLLAAMIGAKRVLEVGVYLGYSAMVWSNAVGPDGRVTGLESNAEYAKLAAEAIAARGLNNVDIVVGSALETLPKLATTEEPYDLVFLDADKANNPEYIKYLLAASHPGSVSGGRLLRPGALIVADNVLQEGHVLDGDSKSNPFVDGVRAYNDYCKDHARLQTVVLPLWDGLGVSRLVD
ncbi:O-methyltransferase, family 3 [Cordyceps fumosorosea ARSEF 2679]|uniref:O-methyltransferase, family 3 n=1 Tax=Cordyceps fumosorosea (strain ARSEF 2679) TaxID=1081104 RepID=A0A167LM60_CORFA|nr:O-methyltransferase, family 3 [Cordyceps fumosorosea ARSEF 2679]OAA53247.1 O-methyltransferase, family 3 [Cordyceps fumosorosea ARSEF 2679]